MQHVRRNFRSKSGRGASPCLSCWWLDMRELSSSPPKYTATMHHTLASDQSRHVPFDLTERMYPRCQQDTAFREPMLARRALQRLVVDASNAGGRPGKAIRFCSDRNRAAGHAVHALECRLVVVSAAATSIDTTCTPIVFFPCDTTPARTICAC